MLLSLKLFEFIIYFVKEVVKYLFEQSITCFLSIGNPITYTGGENFINVIII